MGGINCVYLAEDTAKWQDVVNTVMNFGFYKMWGIPLLAEEIVDYQDCFWSIYLVS